MSQALTSGPYTNYFLSTCHVAGTVILTSPQPDSNLTLIGPRLVAAFPAGNSGVAVFWEPQNGKNGTLGLKAVAAEGGNLTEVYIPAGDDSKSGKPAVGLSGVLEFNSSATLTVALLGSIRTIRDFIEGPSILVEPVQNAIKVEKKDGGSVVLSRMWFDNKTTTTLGFAPIGDGSKLDIKINEKKNTTVTFEAGQYMWYTAYDFEQLEQLESSKVLSDSAKDLIQSQPDRTTSLSFLSYTQKLLAGTWRFLTYFGRDSMIAALLLEPILSTGENSAMEAVIGAVLERINQTDGSVSHEETLGDYATYLNAQQNLSSSDPTYTYQMIDTDYYLPIIMERYFLQSAGGNGREKAVLSKQGGDINPVNKNLTWGELANLNAEKIMGIAGRFAADGNQTKDNLAHLKDGQVVGQWRDSEFGIGGGRIPFDVNTGLMPAALHSISSLAKAGVYDKHPEWADDAKKYAKVWEDKTLKFFEVKIKQDDAKQRIDTYVERSKFGGPAEKDAIDGDLLFYSISLEGHNDLEQVQVMHTDDCFRLFLVNGSDQQIASEFINQAALNTLRTFPAGLMSEVGLLVANPAYGLQEVYAENFTTSAYHGTVVWSWQQAMMAKGFENQLLRCKESSPPDFCKDDKVHGNVLKAYNTLWDVLEKNEEHLSEEVWSWKYNNGFEFTELGDLPPPPGTSPTGESTHLTSFWDVADINHRIRYPPVMVTDVPRRDAEQGSEAVVCGLSSYPTPLPVIVIHAIQFLHCSRVTGSLHTVAG